MKAFNCHLKEHNYNYAEFYAMSSACIDNLLVLPPPSPPPHTFVCMCSKCYGTWVHVCDCVFEGESILPVIDSFLLFIFSV